MFGSRSLTRIQHAARAIHQRLLGKEQLRDDEDVDDAAPLGGGERNDHIHLEMDKVPETMKKPSTGHKVAAQLRRASVVSVLPLPLGGAWVPGSLL